MTISIIIPVYNECEKIVRDIAAAGEFINNNDFTGEIIVVDDGSKDGTAEAAQSEGNSSGVDVRVVSYETHKGKGYAVRTGMKSAKGEHIMFADSGLCIPYDYVLTGLKILKSGDFDLAHGSRRLPDSKILKRKPLLRRFIPKLFRWIFIHWLNVPSDLTDTQCGFKLYRGEVAHKLYDQCVTDGFLFDVEIILRALKSGFRIKEFPVEWTADLDSRLSIVRNSFGVLRELVNLKRLLYHF